MLAVMKKDFGAKISLEDAHIVTQVFAAGTIRVAAQCLDAGQEIDVPRLGAFLARLAARGINVMASEPEEG
jgi:hypothetical protein